MASIAQRAVFRYRIVAKFTPPSAQNEGT